MRVNVKTEPTQRVAEECSLAVLKNRRPTSEERRSSMVSTGASVPVLARNEVERKRYRSALLAPELSHAVPHRDTRVSIDTV